jgi:hypothetical protein
MSCCYRSANHMWGSESVPSCAQFCPAAIVERYLATMCATLLNIPAARPVKI